MISTQPHNLALCSWPFNVSFSEPTIVAWRFLYCQAGGRPAEGRDQFGDSIVRGMSNCRPVIGRSIDNSIQKKVYDDNSQLRLQQLDSG